MLISVAICTLNRAELLRRTLESLATMRVPVDIDWEMVVVNNGCTDHTDAVIAAFAGRLPIRREFEPQRGLSHARNRAVDAARGDYIVWTDDDVLVDPLWLAAYAGAFRRLPEGAVFGGPIIPRYAVPVPKWITESESLLGGAFAIRDFGEEPRPLSVSEERLPFGANYAIRATDQRAFRYDPDLGTQPGRRLVGEETDVIERMLNSGASGRWVPAARVEHCISRDRQNTGFVFRHYAACAESDAMRGTTNRGADRLMFRAPRWLWRRCAEEWLRYRLHRLFSPAPTWVAHLTGFAYYWGQIRYWRRRR